MKTKLYAGCLLASLTLAGCNGNSESMGDITVNVEGDVIDNSVTTTTPVVEIPVAQGLCAQVKEATFVSFNADCSKGTVKGTINQDYTFMQEVEYILSGVVKVGNGNIAIASKAEYDAVVAGGVSLTIEAGTSIKGAADGVLLVTRGSKLIADGSSSQPITFSSLDEGFNGYGEWGGVVIQGFAPQYGKGDTGACFNSGEVWCNVLGEGGDFVKEYGGNIAGDDSGIVRYVRIAEGGLIAGPNNEINGLTLQGVGYGTVIDYIQIHGNQDDGIEWFGGTVNVTHAVLTNNDDDDIDFDEFSSIPRGSFDPMGTAPRVWFLIISAY